MFKTVMELLEPVQSTVEFCYDLLRQKSFSDLFAVVILARYMVHNVVFL